MCFVPEVCWLLVKRALWEPKLFTQRTYRPDQSPRLVHDSLDPQLLSTWGKKKHTHKKGKSFLRDSTTSSLNSVCSLYYLSKIIERPKKPEYFVLRFLHNNLRETLIMWRLLLPSNEYFISHYTPTQTKLFYMSYTFCCRCKLAALACF